MMFLKARRLIVLFSWGAFASLSLFLLLLGFLSGDPPGLPVLIAAGAVLFLFFFLARFSACRILRPLEERNRREGRFLSDAEHALKTPLSVIAANADLLSREDPDNPWIGNIREENRRMAELVSALLGLSRCAEAPLRAEDVDLSDLVRGEVLPFESLAFERGLSIRARIGDGIRLRGDPSLLSGIVRVLLDNAVRYTEGGTEILLSLSEEGGRAVLRTENSSAPLSPEETGRLFERFYRPERDGEDSGDHCGLGLPAAKAAAELHKGKIRAEWRDGRMAVTVSLPVCDHGRGLRPGSSGKPVGKSDRNGYNGG